MSYLTSVVHRNHGVTAPAQDIGSESAVEQLSVPRLLALFLLPGALTAAAFVILAPLVESVGYPPIMALLVSIAVVLIPVEVGVVVHAGRGRSGPNGSVVPYRRHLPLLQWLWLLPALVAAAFVGFGVSMAIEPGIIDALFGWLPAWYVMPIDVDRIDSFSRSAWLITLGLYFVLNGLAGPIAEEIYFRGYLLPRMERMGRWAPLVNVSLFSLYHFWSPWQLIGRILGFGPTVYAVRWKKNIYLGMVVHCTLNTLGVLLVAGLVLGRI